MRSNAELIRTIRRESPVKAYIATVVSKSQANDTAVIRLNGGSSMEARTAMNVTDIGYGQEVLCLRVDGSAKPIIISTMAQASTASSSGSSGSQARNAYAPDEVIITEDAYTVIAQWDCPYPYSNYCFMVQRSTDGVTPLEDFVIVTKGSYYLYHNTPGTHIYIRVASLLASNGGLVRSGWTEWADGTTLEPFEIEALTENSLTINEGILSLDNQNAMTVLAGPTRGNAATVPQFRQLNFIELGDTPTTYNGSNGLYVKVSGDRLVFASIPDSGGGSVAPYTRDGSIQWRWVVDGRLAIVDEVDGIWKAPTDMVLRGAWIYCMDTGESGSTLIDIEMSTDGITWTTIFNDPGQRPELAYDDVDKQAISGDIEVQVTQGTLFRVNIETVADSSESLTVMLEATISGRMNMLPILGVGHRSR